MLLTCDCNTLRRITIVNDRVPDTGKFHTSIGPLSNVIGSEFRLHMTSTTNLTALIYVVTFISHFHQSVVKDDMICHRLITDNHFRDNCKGFVDVTMSRNSVKFQVDKELTKCQGNLSDGTPVQYKKRITEYWIDPGSRPQQNSTSLGY